MPGSLDLVQGVSPCLPLLLAVSLLQNIAAERFCLRSLIRGVLP